MRPSESPSRQHIVVLTGAGMSAESGLSTFRGQGGLWENHRVEDVATFDAWQRDPALVLRFYNERRRNLLKAEPNAGHAALVELERSHDVSIVTQNVDDLHERAGSTRVLHLHGELRKARSTANERLVYPIEGSELNLGDRCELGSQLRPHIVWFGEAVPLMPQAADVVAKADVLVIVGTSLVVYPAAGLVDYARAGIPIFVVDPAIPALARGLNVRSFAEGASTGLARILRELQGKR